MSDYKLHPEVDYSLDTLVFSITTRCNLSCSFCSRDAGPDGKDLPQDTIIESIDDVISAHKPKVIGITGGEPLLYPGFFKLLEKIKSRNIDVRLNSNCTLVDERIAARLKECNVKQVNTSIDGRYGATHDSIRGVRGSLDRTLYGLDVLKKSGIPFFIKTTVTKTNYREVPGIMEIAIEKGAVGYAISKVVPTGRATNTALLPWEDFKNVAQECLKRAETSDIKFVIDDPTKILINPKLLDYVKSRYESFKETWGGCIAGVNMLYVLSDGSAIPCPALPAPAGNVFSDSITDIWENSGVLLKLRNRSNLKGTCGRCDYKYLCGGCRAMPYALTGDFLDDDEFCPRVPKKHEPAQRISNGFCCGSSCGD